MVGREGWQGQERAEEAWGGWKGIARAFVAPSFSFQKAGFSYNYYMYVGVTSAGEGRLMIGVSMIDSSHNSKVNTHDEVEYET